MKTESRISRTSLLLSGRAAGTVSRYQNVVAASRPSSEVLREDNNSSANRAVGCSEPLFSLFLYYHQLKPNIVDLIPLCLTDPVQVTMTVSSTYTPATTAEDITIEKDGGVLKEKMVEGRGTDNPWTGDKVFVHYVGTLTDGTKFDSSRDRGEKFSFNLGKSEVIKGWDLGVATMKIGEKSMFTIKADYGYGSAGSPPKIPGKLYNLLHSTAASCCLLR